MEITDLTKALPHGLTAVIAVLLYKLAEKVLIPIIKKAKENEDARQANEMKLLFDSIKELTKSVSDLFSTAKLHEHRITESESDIREIRAMVTGAPHVKH